MNKFQIVVVLLIFILSNITIGCISNKNSDEIKTYSELIIGEWEQEDALSNNSWYFYENQSFEYIAFRKVDNNNTISSNQTGNYSINDSNLYLIFDLYPSEQDIANIKFTDDGNTIIMTWENNDVTVVLKRIQH